MSVDKKGDLRIIGWSIDVKWSNGKEESITEIPDDVASVIDDYLTEIEGEAPIDSDEVDAEEEDYDEEQPITAT